MKMKQVYEGNPALGDPMSIQGQLTENGQRLDKLRAELKKFQVVRAYPSKLQHAHLMPDSYAHFFQDILDDVDNVGTGVLSANTLPSGSAERNSKSTSIGRRSSVSDGAESLSRSASDSSVANGKTNGGLKKHGTTNNNNNDSNLSSQQQGHG